MSSNHANLDIIAAQVQHRSQRQLLRRLQSWHMNKNRSLQPQPQPERPLQTKCDLVGVVALVEARQWLESATRRCYD